jgi:hypothetical protein
MSSYTLEPIGFIRSTVRGREDAPRQGPEGAPDAWLEIEPQFAEASGRTRKPRISARPAEARVSILLYDALDFSTYRYLGRWQSFESVSRDALSATAVAALGPGRLIR